MAYRSDERVVDAARAEERELAALGRDARRRRGRTGAVLGALALVALAAPALASRLPASPAPGHHCHHVTVKYEDPYGSPPPPISWLACEPR